MHANKMNASLSNSGAFILVMQQIAYNLSPGSLCQVIVTLVGVIVIANLGP